MPNSSLDKLDSWNFRNSRKICDVMFIFVWWYISIGATDQWSFFKEVYLSSGMPKYFNMICQRVWSLKLILCMLLWIYRSNKMIQLVQVITGGTSWFTFFKWSWSTNPRLPKIWNTELRILPDRVNIFNSIWFFLSTAVFEILKLPVM